MKTHQFFHHRKVAYFFPNLIISFKRTSNSKIKFKALDKCKVETNEHIKKFIEY